MLYQYLRLFKSTAGVLTDQSLANQDESTNTSFNITTADYFYIGQHFPFNNFYYQMAVANTNAASITLEYYDGSHWRAVVDILDGTSTGGVPLAKSGLIQFSTNKSYKWTYLQDTSDNYAPSELNSITVYNLYWLRLKFSANLSATTSSKQICYAFTSHQQIDNYDTTVNSYLTAFGAGKTTWEDEIITSSLAVVIDLKRNNLLLNRGQVIRIDDVSIATDWRTLIHIYRNLGGDYKVKYDQALIEYEKAIDQKYFSFDTDEDAYIDKDEVANTNYRLVRQ